MKATEAKLLKFLSDRNQLIIPIYQRTYSWTRSQCDQLWQDIVRAGHDETVPAHWMVIRRSDEKHTDEVEV